MKSISLSDLQAKMKEDTRIDASKLAHASLSAPYIYSKYVAIHANEKMWLKTYQKQYASLRLKKTAYYGGDAPEEEYKKEPLYVKVSKSKVSTYVNGDSDIQAFENKLDVQEIKVEMLKEFMKVLYQTSFHIKNAIEYHKFINGGAV